MGKFIGLVIIGAFLVVLGITNIKGNISSIHWYNRTKVTKENVLKYGRCMGTGSIIIGASLIASAVLEWIFKNSAFSFLIVIGCLVGIIFMLYGQIKYNKGIF